MSGSGSGCLILLLLVLVILQVHARPVQRIQVPPLLLR
jgi:hypothetical protein